MAAKKEPENEEFGRILKARREALGLSRRDVVDASGLSYPYVSQLETGYRQPSHRALAALGEALEMSPAELSATLAETLVSSDPTRRAERTSARTATGWHDNPAYAAAESAPPPREPRGESPERVADMLAELVEMLPREQRLNALNLAQKKVMRAVVAEELSEGSP